MRMVPSEEPVMQCLPLLSTATAFTASVWDRSSVLYLCDAMSSAPSEPFSVPMNTCKFMAC